MYEGGKSNKKDIWSEFGIYQTLLVQFLWIGMLFWNSLILRLPLEHCIVLEHMRKLKKLFLKSGFKKNVLKMYCNHVPCLWQRLTILQKRLSHSSFNLNKGWLERFKTRHSIVSRSVIGESANVNADMKNNWLTTKLPNHYWKRLLQFHYNYWVGRHFITTTIKIIHSIIIVVKYMYHCNNYWNKIFQ